MGEFKLHNSFANGIAKFLVETQDCGPYSEHAYGETMDCGGCDSCGVGSTLCPDATQDLAQELSSFMCMGNIPSPKMVFKVSVRHKRGDYINFNKKHFLARGLSDALFLAKDHKWLNSNGQLVEKKNFEVVSCELVCEVD